MNENIEKILEIAKSHNLTLDLKNNKLDLEDLDKYDRDAFNEQLQKLTDKAVQYYTLAEVDTVYYRTKIIYGALKGNKLSMAKLLEGDKAFVNNCLACANLILDNDRKIKQTFRGEFVEF